MQTPTATTAYKSHRFPQEIISHATWLYFRFSLSYRDVEELLAERGIIVTYETVRQWWGCPLGQVRPAVCYSASATTRQNWRQMASRWCDTRSHVVSERDDHRSRFVFRPVPNSKRVAGNGGV